MDFCIFTLSEEELTTQLHQDIELIAERNVCFYLLRFFAENSLSFQKIFVLL